MSTGEMLLILLPKIVQSCSSIQLLHNKAQEKRFRRDVIRIRVDILKLLHYMVVLFFFLLQFSCLRMKNKGEVVHFYSNIPMYIYLHIYLFVQVLFQ